jgi:DNA-binding transcriptional ArsR family regulator
VSETPRGLRELDELDAVFGALAHAARRHILQVLYARHGAMTAGQLAGRFAHSWPTTTRHLKVLIDAGLVTVERHGRERHYVLDRGLLQRTLALWLNGVGLDVPKPEP